MVDGTENESKNIIVLGNVITISLTTQVPQNMLKGKRATYPFFYLPLSLNSSSFCFTFSMCVYCVRRCTCSFEYALCVNSKLDEQVQREL